MLFKNIEEPQYDPQTLAGIPILVDNSKYILYGKNDSCVPIKKYDQTYLESVNKIYQKEQEKSFSISLYELLFTNKTR